jgi:hypothetical protein
VGDPNADNSETPNSTETDAANAEDGTDVADGANADGEEETDPSDTGAGDGTDDTAPAAEEEGADYPPGKADTTTGDDGETPADSYENAEDTEEEVLGEDKQDVVEDIPEIEEEEEPVKPPAQHNTKLPASKPVAQQQPKAADDEEAVPEPSGSYAFPGILIGGCAVGFFAFRRRRRFTRYRRVAQTS